MDWLSIALGWVTIPTLWFLFKHWPKRKRPRMELPKPQRRKVFQAENWYGLDTPAKKARNLKEHREWDTEFYGYIEPHQLIVYNGKLITLEQADRLFFIEEEKRKYK